MAKINKLCNLCISELTIEEMKRIVDFCKDSRISCILDPVSEEILLNDLDEIACNDVERFIEQNTKNYDIEGSQRKCW